MKKNSLGVLIALNVVLVLALLLVLTMPGPVAEAQSRGRGDYMMVAGKVTGRNNQAVIYIFELKTLRMVPAIFDSRNNRFHGLLPRDVGADFRGR